jgi:YggT family protein
MPIIRALSLLINIYMLIIFIRIILTWFSWVGNSGIQDFLSKITDPYLNWFRRFSFLRIGMIDISPVAALVVLSLLNRIFFSLASSPVLTIGSILAAAIETAWSAVSFLLVVGIIILILRLIAYLTNQNTFNRFWRTVDSISQPITYRVSRIFFGDKIVHHLTGILISIGVLILCSFLGGIGVKFLSLFLAGLPF